jgi:plasmid stabilization system protein ParE
MARGSKDKYTDEQKRKAEHIEESYEQKGTPKDEAEARAWATVNKQSGGGEKAGGSGKKRRTPRRNRPNLTRARERRKHAAAMGVTLKLHLKRRARKA